MIDIVVVCKEVQLRDRYIITVTTKLYIVVSPPSSISLSGHNDIGIEASSRGWCPKLEDPGLELRVFHRQIPFGNFLIDIPRPHVGDVLDAKIAPAPPLSPVPSQHLATCSVARNSLNAG